MSYPLFVFLSEDNSNSKTNFQLFLISIILWFYFSYIGALHFFPFLFHGILFVVICIIYSTYLEIGWPYLALNLISTPALGSWVLGLWGMSSHDWLSMCLNGTIFSQESLNMMFSISIFNHFWLVYSLTLYFSLFFCLLFISFFHIEASRDNS